MLGGHGLEVTAVDPATRRIKVAGTLADLSGTFGTTLRQLSARTSTVGRVTHRYREGPLFVPAELDGMVAAILGLDTGPQARPHFRTRGDAAAAQGISYMPVQVAEVYSVPARHRPGLGNDRGHRAGWRIHHQPPGCLLRELRHRRAVDHRGRRGWSL